MSVLNRVLNVLFDALTWPFRWMHPLLGLAILSVLTGIGFLLVFPHVSNQKAIKRVKDLIKAHLLEIRLFKDDLMLIFKSTGQILAMNGLYLLHNMRAMVVLLVPFCLIWFQLNARYAFAPLKVGDVTNFTVKLKPGTPVGDVQLALPAGVVAEATVRIPASSEVDWRLRVTEPGDHLVSVRLGSTTIDKHLVVDGKPRSLAPLRSQSILDSLLYPSEPPIASSAAFAEIKMRYPSQSLGPFSGGEVTVAVVFLLVSLVAGFALKGLFGVQL